MMLFFNSRRFTDVCFIFLTLACTGCSANFKQLATARAGAAGLGTACVKVELKGCDELEKGFENYVLNDKASARRHIQNMIAVNDNLDMSSISEAIQLAAQLAGSQSTQITEFASFLEISVERKPTQPVTASHPPSEVNNKSAQQAVAIDFTAAEGCASDSQCKENRVCIAHECVGIRYAEILEAKYMTRRGISTPRMDAARPDKLVLLSSELDYSLLCSPDEMKNCIRKCEQGKTEYCYFIGKFFEPLFHTDDNSKNAIFGFQKACEQGLSDACVELGKIFFNGRLVPAQNEKAYQYNLMACQKRNAIGCVNTARMIAHGAGVEPDIALSQGYLLSACNLGHKQSCKENK